MMTKLIGTATDMAFSGMRGRFVSACVLAFPSAMAAIAGTLICAVATPVPAYAQGTPASDTAALQQRVRQLEEQIVDMQVVIGTLESLARQGGGAPAQPAVGAGMGGFAGGGNLDSGDAQRLQGIEMQIQALTSQMERLSQQVRGGGSGSSFGPRGDVGPAHGYGAPAAGGEVPGFATASPQASQPQQPPAGGGFGSTTVTPGAPAGGNDAIGGLLSDNAWNSSQQVAAAPLGGVGESPKALYETAYGYLLQQDYGAAETAFSDFLKRYPQDQLAGNAQYWLGESLYVRGQYKAAATAFLKGYQTYKASPKAPDSLLKLAMSLGKLGQRDAACSSYAELTSRFPQAPQHVKSRAASERQRAGC